MQIGLVSDANHDELTTSQVHLIMTFEAFVRCSKINWKMFASAFSSDDISLPFLCHLIPSRALEKMLIQSGPTTSGSERFNEKHNGRKCRKKKKCF